MKLGIVGLPNVGKSTLFNAITNTKNAQAANYPFCTIEPNTGIVPVPDKRLDELCRIWEPDKKTNAVIEFVDIAGLVRGAASGAGLGNKFLGHIRECDAIVHVVRCFDDENIVHVVDDVNVPVGVDPEGDIDAIDMELILADLEVVQNRITRQSKPIIYACNMGEDDLMNGIENNRYFPLVKARAEVEGAEAIPICAKTEEDIAEYTPEEKAEFLAEMGIESSGLDQLIAASYSLLGLISFLTDGKKECRAWTIKKGTKAPQAAGKIHSDFERGFIRAEVCNFNTLMECGGKMSEVKARGLYRSEGKEYVVQDGDIIEFLFNV